jgi:NAD(P)H-hydrate repair Nnr-like enzyme with NAD(P)H-hydrate dehydratase domain
MHIKPTECVSGLPVVLDADGLEMAIRWPEALQGMDRTLLTPNANEFRRLCEATGIQGPWDLG